MYSTCFALSAHWDHGGGRIARYWMLYRVARGANRAFALAMLTRRPTCRLSRPRRRRQRWTIPQWRNPDADRAFLADPQRPRVDESPVHIVQLPQAEEHDRRGIGRVGASQIEVGEEDRSGGLHQQPGQAGVDPQPRLLGIMPALHERVLPMQQEPTDRNDRGHGEQRMDHPLENWVVRHV